MTDKPVPLFDLHRELGLAAVRLMGDGKWYSYVKMQHELMKVVPAGVAIRRARKHRRPDSIRGAPTTDELVTSGARDYVREFLRSGTTFEIDQKLAGGKRWPADVPDDRKIRMLKTPRWARSAVPVEKQVGIPYRRGATLAETIALHEEVEHLRDQVANLRIYLIGLGHEKRANEIAPPNDEG